MSAARVVGLCLARAACSERYAPLSEAQLAIALRAQEDMDTAQLPDLVRSIYDARLADPAPDTTRGEYCRHQHACVYSRIATGELIFNHWSDPDLAGSVLGEQLVSADAFMTRNIYLDIPGQSRPNEWILATAHYDASAIFPFPAGDKPSRYHTAEDTPDKVDPDRLERMGRLWIGALAAFASAEP